MNCTSAIFFCTYCSHLSRLHLTGFAVMDAVRRMLLGQCVVLTIERTPQENIESTYAIELTATDIQLNGDGCLTILNYPPFSEPHNASYLECSSQADGPASTSLSYCASQTSMYLLTSPSQPDHTCSCTSPKTYQHSSSDATENTPELFSQVDNMENLSSRTATHSVNLPTLHSTPQSKHSQHHSKNLFLTPELV